MKSINTEILLRNRRVFVQTREAYFEAATRSVDRILAFFPTDANYPEANRLDGLLRELVNNLYHARYYARLSIGGNNVAPPEEINNTERAFVDHVETMYSYARSINRFLRHELLIESFAREHPDVAENLRRYLAEIRKSDFNLIHVNLHHMRKRLTVYNRFMNHVATGSVVSEATTA
jgi:hypothetical protein